MQMQIQKNKSHKSVVGSMSNGKLHFKGTSCQWSNSDLYSCLAQDCEIARFEGPKSLYFCVPIYIYTCRIIGREYPIYEQVLQTFPTVSYSWRFVLRLTFWMPFSRAIPWNTLISNSNGKMLDAKSWAWRISIFLLRTCVCFCRLWLTTMFPFRYI